MKRVAAALAALFLLTGCMASTELRDRALVQALGVDRIEGDWYASAAIWTSEAGSECRAVSAKGETLEAAMENLSQTAGKELFCGHSKLIVLGEGVFDDGIDRALELFAENRDIRADCPAAAAESAGEIIEGGAAEAAARLAFAAKAGRAVRTELMELIAAREDKGEVTLPYIVDGAEAGEYEEYKFRFC